MTFTRPSLQQLYAMIQPDQIYIRKADYHLEQLDDELLLYHLDNTKIIYCNQTASVIWQLCDGQHTVEAMTVLICEAFPEAAETIPDEVKATLQQFLDIGCIKFR